MFQGVLKIVCREYYFIVKMIDIANSFSKKLMKISNVLGRILNRGYFEYYSITILKISKVIKRRFVEFFLDVFQLVVNDIF